MEEEDPIEEVGEDDWDPEYNQSSDPSDEDEYMGMEDIAMEYIAMEDIAMEDTSTGQHPVSIRRGGACVPGDESELRMKKGDRWLEG